MEHMARALEIAREMDWQTCTDPLFRPAKPPAPGMPGLLGKGDPPQHASSAAQPQPLSSVPGGTPLHQASSPAPLQATLTAQPAIIADHLHQPPTPAQPSEPQGAAKPAEKDTESTEVLCPWLEPSFYVSTSELQAVRELDAAKGPV